MTNEPSPTVRRAPSSSTPRGIRRTHDQAFAAHLHLGCKSVHRSSAHPLLEPLRRVGMILQAYLRVKSACVGSELFFRAIAEATRQPGDVADRLSLLGTLNGNEPPCSRPKARVHVPSCMCAAVHCSASATAYALPVPRMAPRHLLSDPLRVPQRSVVRPSHNFMPRPRRRTVGLPSVSHIGMHTMGSSYHHPLPFVCIAAAASIATAFMVSPSAPRVFSACGLACRLTQIDDKRLKCPNVGC